MQKIIYLLLFFLACKSEGTVNKHSILEDKLQYLYKIPVFTRWAGKPFNPKENKFPHPYLYIRDSTSTEIIKNLTNHYLGVVRLYSFFALIEKKDTSYLRILKDHLTDTVIVNMQDYDVLFRSTVIDEMINLSLPMLKNPEKGRLRDSIIFNFNYLKSLEDILYNLKPKAKYYEKVRELAENNHSDEAFIALAAYKNLDDINILKEGLKNLDAYGGIIFKIIELFNNDAFIPYLIFYKEAYIPKAIFHTDDLSYYFNALAKFQKRVCYQILLDLSKREKYELIEVWKENIQLIFNSLHKYYCPLYKKLYNKLKKEGCVVESPIFQRSDYPERHVWWE